MNNCKTTRKLYQPPHSQLSNYVQSPQTLFNEAEQHNHSQALNESSCIEDQMHHQYRREKYLLDQIRQLRIKNEDLENKYIGALEDNKKLKKRDQSQYSFIEKTTNFTKNDSKNISAVNTSRKDQRQMRTIDNGRGQSIKVTPIRGNRNNQSIGQEVFLIQDSDKNNENLDDPNSRRPQTQKANTCITSPKQLNLFNFKSKSKSKNQSSFDRKQTSTIDSTYPTQPNQQSTMESNYQPPTHCINRQMRRECCKLKQEQMERDKRERSQMSSRSNNSQSRSRMNQKSAQPAKNNLYQGSSQSQISVLSNRITKAPAGGFTAQTANSTLGSQHNHQNQCFEEINSNTTTCHKPKQTHIIYTQGIFSQKKQVNENDRYSPNKDLSYCLDDKYLEEDDEDNNFLQNNRQANVFQENRILNYDDRDRCEDHDNLIYNDDEDEEDGWNRKNLNRKSGHFQYQKYQHNQPIRFK
ncbi:UNKNOWN [Stylonychia lemnae]|uniref:Uncharacterized protein n=1 Tax=Stylonychia lemnae TaxID=5949 RepID=A0A077ZU54_STYLE|nr:UNKNOWN [Stylonychia lemnae]|eukprot:CDW73438.1 UNKNOWN [Stylonychia lemnae]